MATGMIQPTPFDTTSVTDSLNKNKINLSDEPTPSGYAGDKLNTAQEEIAGSAISAGAGAIATGIGAGFQAKENERAQDEARAMYTQERASDLKQQNISNSLKKRSISQEERAMQLSQRQQNYDLRINRFLNKIQRAVESQQEVIANSEQMFSSLNNENIRSAIMKSFV